MSQQPLIGLIDPVNFPSDETLVADDRNQRRPSDMIDRRLRRVLGHSPLFHTGVSDLMHGRRPLAKESGPNRIDIVPPPIVTDENTLAIDGKF